MRHFLSELFAYFPRLMPVFLLVSTVSSILEGAVLLLLYPFLAVLLQGSGGLNQTGRLVQTLHQFGINPTALSMTVLLLVAACLQYGTRIAYVWMSARMQALYVSRLRRDLFKTFFGARWPFFVNAASGELANALNLESVRAVVVLQNFIMIVTSLVMALILVVSACLISWKGTLVFMGSSVLMGWICFQFLFGRTHAMGVKLSDVNEVFTGWVSNALANAKFFKATASEGVAAHRVDQIMDDMVRPLAMSNFIPQLSRGIVEFCATLMFMGFVAFSALVIRMDFLAMVILMGIFLRLLPRLVAVQESVQSLGTYTPVIAHLRELRLRATAMKERYDADDVAGLAHTAGPAAVSIRGLGVSYDDYKVLDDVSMEIPAGGFIAIVGQSGAGKTTLIDSLLGLVEHQKGDILIDGTPLLGKKLAGWRREVGYQSQDAFMMNDSINANIVWGEEQVSAVRMNEALRKAGLGKFIGTLTDGLETSVGENGCKLSGGQRQRVGLARTLLSRKRLLILDEATSALDPATEREVIDNIQELKGDITILMVTHRLALARFADRIYVLGGGKVVEEGTWAELMQSRGAFHGLWQHQKVETGPELSLTS